MYNSRFPYGNAFLVSTPAMDRVGQMMINDQKLMAAQTQKESENLDQSFAKNISGIRDEDITDASNDWQQYKDAAIDLYKNGNKYSNQERIQKEYKKQQSLANFYQNINNSKEAGKGISDINKRLYANPKIHYDDATTLLQKTQGVKTKDFNKIQRDDPNGEIDPSTGKIKQVNYNPLDYTGTYVDHGSMEKWEPLVRNSVGKLEQKGKPIETLLANGAGKEVQTIKGYNSPASQWLNLMSGMPSPQGVKHFNNTMRNTFTEDRAKQIATDYTNKAQNDPLWAKAYTQEEMSLHPLLNALMNEDTRNIALTVMSNALAHEPTVDIAKVQDDKVALQKQKDDTKVRITDIKEGGKNYRTGVLVGKVQVPNVIKQAEEDNGEVQSDGSTYIPFSAIDPKYQDFILPKSKVGQKLVNPYPREGEPNGQGGLLRKNGKLYGVNRDGKPQVIDEDRITTDIYNYKKSQLDAESKGKISPQGEVKETKGKRKFD